MRADLYVGVLMCESTLTSSLCALSPCTLLLQVPLEGTQAKVWTSAFPWMLDEVQGSLSSKEKSRE